MTTLAVMKTRIADELVRDDISSQIGEAIQSAITIWEASRFSFNEKRFSLATVADQEYYDWSAMLQTDGSALQAGETMLEVDSIVLTRSGIQYRLRDRTHEWVDDNQAPTTSYTGQPYDYAIYSDQLRFYPIPDAVYDLTISGHARLATLATDAASNAWMTEGEPLIRAQAKLILCRDILRDEKGEAAATRAMAEAANSIERKMMKKARTGEIRAWQV